MDEDSGVPDKKSIRTAAVFFSVESRKAKFIAGNGFITGFVLYGLCRENDLFQASKALQGKALAEWFASPKLVYCHFPAARAILRALPKHGPEAMHVSVFNK